MLRVSDILRRRRQRRNVSSSKRYTFIKQVCLMTGSSATTTAETPAWYQTAGITLAIFAGFFTGSSMILQKKGLISTRKIVLETGNEFAYLKSGYWWGGMLSLALGEVSNFVAYAFSPAILVAPLMAISVVVSAIMSVIYLNEKLNFTATSGIILCLIGSIIIVLHAPSSTATQTLPEFFSYVLSPGFLVYFFLCALLLAYLVFRLGPRYGHAHPAVYLITTALGGAFLVCSAQGLGASILYSLTHWETDNQFLRWEFYPLTAFVVATVLFQVNHLNKALACFSASIVTPLNYVFFSTATIVTSSILYKGFNVSSVVVALTIVMGFFVIVVGVALLFQYNLKMSKLALMSRHIEDINDEDVVVETPADDDPFKLMNEVFPVDSSKDRRVSRIRPIATRLANRPGSPDGNPEHYVRAEDPDVGPPGISDTLIASNIIPQASLSQQLQQRTEMMSMEQPPSTTTSLTPMIPSSEIPVEQLTAQVTINIDVPPPSAVVSDQQVSGLVDTGGKTDLVPAHHLGDIESVYEESVDNMVVGNVGIGISVANSGWQPPGYTKLT